MPPMTGLQIISDGQTYALLTIFSLLDGASKRERLPSNLTAALIPTNLDGISIGRRHLPMNVPFQNGPTSGKDVFVHISALEAAGIGNLNEGDSVSFEVVSEKGKEKASDLKTL